MAWEKRQTALQGKYEQAAWPIFDPAMGSRMWDSARRASEANVNTPPGSGGLGRRANAATIAQVARKWRDYQRVRRQRERKFLDSTQTVDG